MNIDAKEIYKNRKQQGKVISKEMYNDKGERLCTAYVYRSDIINSNDTDVVEDNTAKGKKYVLAGGLVGLAAVIGLTALLSNKKCSSSKDNINTGNEQPSVSGEEIPGINGNETTQNFVANDLYTMNNQCKLFILDALNKGINFTADEAMSLYIMFNSQSLNNSFISLLGETVSVAGLSKSFDAALIKLKEAAMLDHIPNFDLIISDANSANNINELITQIYNWYKASNKESASVKYADYIKDRFFVNGYTSGVKEPGVELAMIMLTAGVNTILINNEHYQEAFNANGIDVQTLWTSKDLINEIIDCSEGKLMGTTLYSQKYRALKETLSEKITYAVAMRNNDKENADYWNEMIENLNAYINSLNINVSIPTVQEMREHYDTTIYASDPLSENYIPEITEEDIANMGTDENGNTVIYTTPSMPNSTPSPSNSTTTSVSVDQEQWQKGYNDGYADAGLNRNKKNVSSDSSSYQEGYEFGYDRYVSLHTQVATPEPTPIPTPYETIIPVGTSTLVTSEPSATPSATPSPTAYTYETIEPVGTPAPVTPSPTTEDESTSIVTSSPTTEDVKKSLISIREKLIKSNQDSNIYNDTQKRI